MGTNVNLTPRFEALARELIDDGRYNNVSEVVRDGMRMVEEREEQRRLLLAMIREAEEDVAQNGTVSLDEVLQELDEIIAAAEK